MKKGFIEMIEEGKVVVIFDDGSQEEYNQSLFPNNIYTDMNVVIEKGKVVEVSPPSEELKREIKKLTDKLFVPFKDRKKK